MARKHDVSELAKFVRRLEKYTIKTAPRLDTTLSSATTAPAASLSVAAITNASDLDYLCLIGQGGEGDLLQVSGAPSGTTITLAYKTLCSAAIGSRVVEMAQVDVGHLDESGVTYTASAQKVDRKASTSRIPLYSYMDTGSLGGSAALLEQSMENWATVHGQPEAGVLGTGTASDPLGLMISGTKMGTESFTIFRGVLDMADGVTTGWIDFVNCTVTPNVNAGFGSSNAPSLGLSWSCTAAIPRLFQ